MQDKVNFLKQNFIPLLRQIPADRKPLWGTMTAPQMIEHLVHAIRLSSGRFSHSTLLTPAEKIPQMQAFLMSDKPFPQSTPNPFLQEGLPTTSKFSDLNDAINEVQSELDYYFGVIESNDEFQMLHPYFGELNTEMNVQQLYKHMMHHLTQFGIAI